jgi:hypothetical protein
MILEESRKEDMNKRIKLEEEYSKKLLKWEETERNRVVDCSRLKKQSRLAHLQVNFFEESMERNKISFYSIERDHKTMLDLFHLYLDSKSKFQSFCQKSIIELSRHKNEVKNLSNLLIDKMEQRKNAMMSLKGMTLNRVLAIVSDSVIVIFVKVVI